MCRLGCHGTLRKGVDWWWEEAMNWQKSACELTRKQGGVSVSGQSWSCWCSFFLRGGGSAQSKLRKKEPWWGARYTHSTSGGGTRFGRLAPLPVALYIHTNCQLILVFILNMIKYCKFNILKIVFCRLESKLAIFKGSYKELEFFQHQRQP